MLSWVFEQGGWNNIINGNPPPLSSVKEIFTECYNIYNPLSDNLIEMTSHEYMARYEADLLAELIAEYDNNQETDKNKYKAIALVGLENTQRYSGNTPTSLGYSDPFMDKNKKKLTRQMYDARQQDPCN